MFILRFLGSADWDMTNIAIIGVGQLGSRHLQSLALSDRQLNIDLVDTSTDALKLAIERFMQSSSNGASDKTIRLHSTIESISDNIDIAIISTNSDIRADVLRKLLAIKTVKYLFLEKILFQRIEDYYSVEKLLSERKVATWVNCYLRSRPPFRKVKEEINPSVPLEVIVSGTNWGLATGGIHFLDYFSFLSGIETLSILKLGIQEIYESKRRFFFETNGYFDIMDGKNNRLSIISNPGEKLTTSLTIKNGNCFHTFSAWDGNIKHLSKNGNEMKKEICYIERHSEFTQIIVEQMLKGKCDLPTYAEAMKIHVPYISAFLKEFNRINNTNTDICPIT